MKLKCVTAPAVAASSAGSSRAPDPPATLPATSKRGKADASVTVPGLGVVSVYDKYKHMEVNCKTRSKCGR